MVFELEPGPIDRIDETALRPFPQLPSFEGLVAGALEGLRGADDGLARQRLDVGDEGPPDLDAAYASTVAVSEETLAAQRGAEDDQVAGVLVDTTAGAEAYRQAALPHLPQPAAPIEGDFVDPPRPPNLDDDARRDRGERGV